MATINQNNEPQKRFLVRKAIGMNPLLYDNFIHRNFVTWCEILSMKFFLVDRDLIASEAIFKYYLNQWAILVENKMISEYGAYIKKDLPDSGEIYTKVVREYARELENYYPASLLPKKTKALKNDKYQFNYN